MSISLIVGSCDKYSFIWNKFFTLFNKYWDKNIDIQKFFLTENCSTNDPNFISLAIGNGEWTHRLKLALQRINTPYILWMQDDYFLRKTISNDKFLQYIEFIQRHDIDRFGIHENSNLYSLSDNDCLYSQFNQKSLYTISMQASIWKKTFLESCFQNNEETIWQFEVDGSQRLNKKKHKIFFDIQDPPWYLEALRKGQFTQDYYNICKEENL